MPGSIEHASFLTTQEKQLLRDSLASSYEAEAEHFSWAEVLSTFTSPHLWLIMIGSIAWGSVTFSLVYFLPTILKAFNYDVWTTQLLTGRGLAEIRLVTA